MLSIMLRRVGLFTVYAENEKPLLKPSELDIYQQSDEVEAPPDSQSFMYRYVSAGRHGLCEKYPGLLRTHEIVSNVCSFMTRNITCVAGSISGACNEARTNPYLLLTPASLVLAGGVGAVIAGKGKRPFKRSLFALGFGGTAAAVTNPTRALEIATTSYYHTTALPSIIQLWWKKDDQTITEKLLNEELSETKEDSKEPVSETILFEEPPVDHIAETIVVDEQSKQPVAEAIVPVEQFVEHAIEAIVSAEESVVKAIADVEPSIESVAEAIVAAEQSVEHVVEAIVDVEQSIEPVIEAIVVVERSVEPVVEAIVGVELPVVPVVEAIVVLGQSIGPVVEAIAGVEQSIESVAEAIAAVEQFVEPVVKAIAGVEQSVGSVAEAIVAEKLPVEQAAYEPEVVNEDVAIVGEELVQRAESEVISVVAKGNEVSAECAPVESVLPPDEAFVIVEKDEAEPLTCDDQTQCKDSSAVGNVEDDEKASIDVIDSKPTITEGTKDDISTESVSSTIDTIPVS